MILTTMILIRIHGNGTIRGMQDTQHHINNKHTVISVEHEQPMDITARQQTTMTDGGMVIHLRLFITQLTQSQM